MLFTYEDYKKFKKRIDEINAIENIDNKKEELTICLKSIEEKIAQKFLRQPCNIEILIVPNGSKKENASFDPVLNEIKIEVNETIDAEECLIGLFHESTHSNQENSTLNTDDKKILYEISQILYIEPSENDEVIPLEYCCNYKELEARFTEMKLMIELHNDISLHSNISVEKEMKPFLYAIEGLSKYSIIFTNFNLQKLQINNIQRILFNDYEKENSSLNKREILKFLLIKAPKLYKTMYTEIASAKEQLIKIYRELFDKHNTVSTQQEQINLTEDEINFKEKIINSIEKSDKYRSFIEQNDFVKSFYVKGIDKLEETINILSDKDDVLEFNVVSNIEDDIYKISCMLTSDSDIANNVLSENELVTLITEIDENQKEL